MVTHDYVIDYMITLTTCLLLVCTHHSQATRMITDDKISLIAHINE